ncbi:unnamed protein product [Onchocerca flexuosa]|uniref:Secreted protein n=1 Tax=Onchocerca flexuosa TaxID=387005 RepID=A0A183I3K9_9BILA|nr:unnamed protein product [Onchocerca flexuosa]
MSCPTLVVVTILLQVTLVENLDCFTGRLDFGLMFAECSSSINYCVKATSIDPECGRVIDKGCDMENFCHVS